MGPAPCVLAVSGSETQHPRTGAMPSSLVLAKSSPHGSPSVTGFVVGPGAQDVMQRCCHVNASCALMAVGDVVAIYDVGQGRCE